jgi:hypothetical protein
MRKLVGRLLGLALALGAGCGDENVIVMFEWYELIENERVFYHGGCDTGIEDEGILGDDTSSSVFSDGDSGLEVHGKASSKHYTVDVSAEGTALERREYSKSELLSGNKDRFEVETRSGRRYEFTYWGGRECDDPRDRDGG